MDTTSTEAAPAAQPFSFSGNGREYFGIWIVNLALTIVTLGIYSAWAKVRTQRYFYGHTQLDGHRFDYLADPKRILIGRIVAVFLFVLYSIVINFFPGIALAVVGLLVLTIPAILVMSSAFRARNSAYRNIRLHFRKNMAKAYRQALPPLLVALAITAGVYALIPVQIFDPESGTEIHRANFLVPVFFLAVMPLLPWLDYIRTSFIIDHTQYGDMPGAFGAGVWDFYKVYLKLGLSLAGLFVVALIMIFILAMAVGLAGGDGAPDDTLSGVAAVAGILAVIVMYIGLFFLAGWFAALRNNLIRNHTTFGSNRMHGRFRGRDLGWITLSNIVATVLTLGIFIPWAAVRLARYNAEHTDMETAGLDAAVAVRSGDTSAIGEEVGGIFDIDIGL